MLFIFAVTLALNAVVEFIGEDSLKSLLGGSALLQPVIAAIFGFIPNSAASVVITELYISGGLGFGAAVAGLCTGAGTGLLMLFPRKPQHTPESDDNGHNVCGGKPERHRIAADHCLKPQRGKIGGTDLTEYLPLYAFPKACEVV